MSKTSRLRDFREVPRTWCKSSRTAPVALPLRAIALMPAVALQRLGKSITSYSSVTSIHQYASVCCVESGLESIVSGFFFLIPQASWKVLKGVTFCDCGKRPLRTSVFSNFSQVDRFGRHLFATSLFWSVVNGLHPKKNQGNL